jgi:hypothetical protein
MNAEQLGQMQQMLACCLNPNNASRVAAEKLIAQHLNDHREVFIFGLVKLIRTCPEANVSHTETHRQLSTMSHSHQLVWNSVRDSHLSVTVSQNKVRNALLTLNSCRVYFYTSLLGARAVRYHFASNSASR